MSNTQATVPEAPWKNQTDRWARDLLEVDHDAPAADVVDRVLHRLEDADFVPPASWDVAVRHLAAADEPADGDLPPWARSGGEELHGQLEDKLKRKVEKLAREFLDLPGADRKRRWVQLAFQAEFSEPLSARLDHLKRGLNVEVPDVEGEGEHIATLLRHVVDTFPLPPNERVAANWWFVVTHGGRPRRWKTVAACVRRRFSPGCRVGSHVPR